MPSSGRGRTVLLLLNNHWDNFMSKNVMAEINRYSGMPVMWVAFMACCICLMPGMVKGQGNGGDDWQLIDVPGSWNESGIKELANHDGFAWYRTFVFIPKEWEGKRVFFSLGSVDNIEETFFNGEKIGAYGSMPPLLQGPASDIRRPYVIEPDMFQAGDWNLLALRLFDMGGNAGIRTGPVQLSSGDKALDLSGKWLILKGDFEELSDWPHGHSPKDRRQLVEDFNTRVGRQGPQPWMPVDYAGREKAIRAATEGYNNNSNVHSNLDGKGPPLSPEQVVAGFTKPPFLDVQVALKEPEVRQPLYVEFDERGRMWVTQYIQYPEPAGIKLVTWDRHLRAIYDQDPPPPPFTTPEHQKFIGKDKITIHEDTDGDGIYESGKTFMDGLNIVTSTAQDRDGVWVMNPPYLLFVPDRNKDDVPDSDPVVHLSGFGLEDTHSVANSLKWGPDGWLYGVTGSTVTARVKVHFDPTFKPLKFFGQTVWRYHPEDYRFELFAEGGWNNFGLEFDDHGRIFSGTNGGMQAVYFYQGGYYQKGFGKHGPHNNPYAFDYLGGLPLKGDTRRMVHQWIIYGGGAIPEYKDVLLGVNPLSNFVMAISRHGSGNDLRTEEVHKTVATDHKWFRPVHITPGPDGALYLSDFYDARITHLDPRDNWDREHGRIYRIHSNTAPKFSMPDLTRLAPEKLVTFLHHENRWFRETARRLLVENEATSTFSQLSDMLISGSDQSGLEALWVLHRLNLMNPKLWNAALTHDFFPVRMWGIRLQGDSTEELSADNARGWLNIARSESHPEVIAQLLCSARRQSNSIRNQVLDILFHRDYVADDQVVKFLSWWASEESYRSDASGLLRMLSEGNHFAGSQLFRDGVFPNLVRRAAADPTGDNLDMLAFILRNVEDGPLLSKAVDAMEKSLSGRSLREVPNSLASSLTQLSTRFGDNTNVLALALKIAGNQKDIQSKAINLVRNKQIEPGERLRVFRALTGVEEQSLTQASQSIAIDSTELPDIRRQALNYLKSNPDQVVVSSLLNRLGSGDSMEQEIMLALTGYSRWADSLVKAIIKGQVDKSVVDSRGMVQLNQTLGATHASQLSEIWPESFKKTVKASSEQMEKDISEVRAILNSHVGREESGRDVFNRICAACHKMDGAGGVIGPDLTGYERDNLDYLLTAIIDPNLAIREEYELIHVRTGKSGDASEVGSVYSGFPGASDDDIMILRDLTGAEIEISRSTILGIDRSPVSLMPEGLLKSLKPQESADLFKFLQKQKP